MRFEWDTEKADANLAKHGVSFEQARELFTSGIDYLVLYDEAHSSVEERFVAIGSISIGVVVVAYGESGEDAVRVISVRLATSREKRLLGEHTGRREGR